VAVITFTNAAYGSPIGPLLVSTGCYGCGKQVLQVSSNLTVGGPGWSDLATNAYPRPQNLWRVQPPATGLFYRIKATN
jgi:hypothetical protein